MVSELQSGTRIRGIRQARHLTLRDVADRAGATERPAAVDEFLTSNMAGRLQMTLSTIEPGGDTAAEPYTHDPDEEVVVIMRGTLDPWVADEHVLDDGDALTFPSRLPHWNANHGGEPAVVLFCLTPPSF